MPREIDRRAARTRRALHQALLALMLRKGYEALSVQDIIDEADVGRSTFYAHYAGKEDLLRSGFQMLRQELIEASAARAGAEASGDDPLGFSTAMFDHAARYADHYRTMIGGRGGAVTENEIRLILSEMVRQELPAALHGDVPRDFVVQFIVGAFLTALNWWFERKPKLSPSQVDAMFRSLVLDGLSPSIGGKRVPADRPAASRD
ncbi:MULTISPECIES: TetR/AcrR family transcriptional regulator [unclassified Mesorhizobium]|uniref:TetR/AcrR family transcriptional regulator n=1 Tax=unclassified Mesorhizobium TaxID=325217 RepID=UPI000FCB7788|nr:MULTISPECIES: TetR/AcrR family transcriptional regulator [unclassified Mesorhizobium]TGP23638.1 TetR/AcrR family transcriptional regulator [Mesorhizobium sp. M1D.F.Ca.ET.231.01.1.1]TGP33782.1 TetR/AcrR family transcriptional regulator [Mesorhizobium sp. M1D.F.Ca.ET.234.01.1.1]TGS47148.1 TetR/AcrR family transcriptional regulator [Mesorhizobium sp. M1D.F.Ca.ET.184.01.1.1]TGS62406.1 TetR/AcrR family transcriptional regulator [Mesorhizobium sp. M1D.F.Ca.ET.183.01.1.1]